MSQNQLVNFEIYSDFLIEYNEKVNLTSITEPEDIIIKHFMDSLTVFSAVKLKAGDSVIDIGTGAGFPGVPLRIASPELSLTLMDSLNKRIVFLHQLCQRLGQENCFIHGRAEEKARDKELREQFDYAVSRAVASLPALSEYCLPYVKVSGCFIAMKGPDIEDELDKAQNAISLLGGKLEDVIHLNLPKENKRTLIVIRKISQTPLKYPRKAVKITKTPLS